MSQLTDSMLFRQRLYDNFKDSGLLSKLKTSLRANLLQKLQKPVPSPDLPSNVSEANVPFHLRNKFLESIVVQHLLLTKKQYALSILMAECNLQEQDCLRYNELSEIINLGKPAHQRSFLHRLVEEFANIRCVQAKERQTQTDFDQPLSKKMEIIDKQYKVKIDYWKLIPGSSVSKVPDSLYQHQMKLRLKFNEEKEQLKRELQHSIKQEMEKKYENQYLFRMRQVQKQHEGRLNELKLREKAVLDGLDRKKKDIEEKSRKTSEDELRMISKYEIKTQELEAEYKARMKEIEAKEKDFWKKELELKAKKREYEQTIRLVKQKVIGQAAT